MRALEHKKMLMLIAPRDLQRLLVDTLRGVGIGGYTAVPASGAGTTGLQSGFLDSDSNVVIYVILSEERLLRALEQVDALMRAGYRIKALVQDIAMLPRKAQQAQG
jgi:hypothetical protein